MRTDQIYGFTKWTQKFVQGEQVLTYTEQVVRVHPNGKEEEQPDRPIYESTVKKEESGEHFEGMFGDQYPLHKFTFPNGNVYYERVQAAPWSSGPCFFLALQNKKGNWIPKSLWSKDVIEDA